MLLLMPLLMAPKRRRSEALAVASRTVTLLRPQPPPPPPLLPLPLLLQLSLLLLRPPLLVVERCALSSTSAPVFNHRSQKTRGGAEARGGAVAASTSDSAPAARVKKSA
jgi:hypothetical protein